MTQEELAALDAMDNQARNTSTEQEIDQSLLYTDQDLDMSAADDEWEEGRYAFEITDLKLKQSKKAPNFFKYLELTLTCIVGKKKDRKMFDRVMIEGEKPTALARLVLLGKATDMYDAVNKRFQGRYIDLVGKCIWADVVKTKDTFKGEERERTGIGFRGFHHFSKFAIPEEGDLFAEEGVAVEALDTVPELPAEVVQDVAVTDDGSQGEIQEVEGYEPGAEASEGPFVDDGTLETLPAEEAAEEVVEEPAPAPAPAPRPVATPRAAVPATPTATPRAAAAKPPQAGTRPPF